MLRTAQNEHTVLAGKVIKLKPDLGLASVN